MSVHPRGSTELAAYYRRLISAGTLAFLVLVGWTVWSGWQRQYAQEVNLAHQRVHETAVHLKSIVKAATDHLAQMHYWATRFPEHVPYSGPHTLSAFMNEAIRTSHDGEYTLDALMALPEALRLGQMLGVNRAGRVYNGDLPSQRDLGLSLLGRMGDARKTSPFLRWSYFFSADQDLLAVTPWASSQDMLGGAPTIRAFLERSWTYDITTDGLPANNPQRQPYWTPAYQDQAGTGLMVSHGAPVYWGDTFVGVVGTDVLDFLGDLLRSFPDSAGLLLIVNEYGEILGDRQRTPEAQASIRHVTGLLPADWTAWRAVPDNRLSGRSGNERVFIANIDNPLWYVVYRVPERTLVQRALKAYSAALGLAGLLISAAIVTQWALWRMYVAPALQIAHFVAQETSLVAHDSGTQMPRFPCVPGLWRPWTTAMAQAFRDRRRYMAQLEASNEALERTVDERTRELVNANQRLEKLSVTDPLTGAFNRRHLFEVLEKERQRIRRGGENMAVLMVDLDHFKQINDRYGHAAGDAVLCEFVQRCLHTVRITDTVCRYGGEEFVIVLPAQTRDHAGLLAERLRVALAETPVVFDGRVIPFTASIGVASYRDPENLQDMLNRADQRLYRAKQNGRNQVCVA